MTKINITISEFLRNVKIEENGFIRDLEYIKVYDNENKFIRIISKTVIFDYLRKEIINSPEILDWNYLKNEIENNLSFSEKTTVADNLCSIILLVSLKLCPMKINN